MPVTYRPFRCFLLRGIKGFCVEQVSASYWPTEELKVGIAEELVEPEEPSYYEPATMSLVLAKRAMDYLRDIFRRPG